MGNTSVKLYRIWISGSGEKYRLKIFLTYSCSGGPFVWQSGTCCFVCLLDLILNVPSTIFQLNRGGSSWVEPVIS